MLRSACLLAALLVVGSDIPASAQDKMKGARVAESQTPQPLRDWTVIHYVAGDNDADEAFAATIKPLKSHVGNAPGLNWVMLVDLAKGYARYDDVFGEDFHDTRIYELQPNRFVRRGGGDVMPQITTTSNYEANTGEATTLRDFIRYAKKYYPARHYALVVISHGWGVAFAPDEDEKHFGDALYPAEISDVLSEKESVDVLILDVCTFSSAEAMYQWRPGNGRFSARWMVASPPGSGSPDYGEFINRITGGTEKSQTPDKALGGMKRSFKPADLTPKDFAEAVLGNFAENNAHECWGLYDLTHAASVKAAFDRLAQVAAGDPKVRRELEAIRGSGREPKTLHYMERTTLPLLDNLLKLFGAADDPRPEDVAMPWLLGPHFDAYDFGRRISESKELTRPVRDAGTGVAEAVDQLVVHSFAGGRQSPKFISGKNGVFFVFPDGSAKFKGNTHWELMRWYTGADLRPQLAVHLAKQLKSAAYKRLRTIENLSPAELKTRKKEIESQPAEPDEIDTVRFGYGRLSWVIDGAAKEDDSVGNWYELLLSWYGTRANQ